MRGYAETGGGMLAEERRVATVLYEGKQWGFVPVRSAATPVYEKVLLVRRSALAALPILRNYYTNHKVAFPENPTAAFLHGVVFDGVQYVVHRHDELSGDVVFRPLADNGTSTPLSRLTDADPDHDVTRFEGEGGATPGDKCIARHTADNWPIGGDRPDVTDRAEGTETIATTSGTLVSAHQTACRKAGERADSEHYQQQADALAPGWGGRDEQGGSDL